MLQRDVLDRQTESFRGKPKTVILNEHLNPSLNQDKPVQATGLKGLLNKSTKNILSFFRFPALRTDTELGKLAWLVRLRWLAITLLFSLAAPGLMVGVLDRSSLPVFIGALGFLLLFNLLTKLIFVNPKKQVGPLFICLQLSLDLIVLTSLLWISGGFTNPFVTLFLLNASLGGILIHGRLGWPFIVLVHTFLIALQLNHIELHRLEVGGTFYALMAASHVLLFSFWLVMRSLGAYLERQHANESRVLVQIEKQDRLRAVGALAAGFSHEFASPLNTVKLRLDRLLRKLEEAKISEADLENVHEAIDAIKSCEHVIHQMNSSQLDARDYHLKPVKISELLKDIIESWQEEHPEALLKTEIATGISGLLPPVNFAQVVLNLLDNAYQSAPNKEFHVYFEFNNEAFQFVVSDKGSGFSPLILERQGEPFITTKPHGTGLGLYVSELFAQSLGGKLILENKSSGGAQVMLAWPAATLSGSLPDSLSGALADSGDNSLPGTSL